jgi:hypothetical protein
MLLPVDKPLLSNLPAVHRPDDRMTRRSNSPAAPLRPHPAGEGMQSITKGISFLSRAYLSPQVFAQAAKPVPHRNRSRAYMLSS